MTEVIRPGAYRLEDNNGNVLTNTWNIEQLHHFSPKFGLNAFQLTHAPIKNALARTLSARALGGFIRIQYQVLPLFPLLSHDKQLCPRMEAHSIPLITLRNFVLTPNRTHPATTYGHEQLSPEGHAQVLKSCSLWNERACAKKKGLKQSYARIKNK